MKERVIIRVLTMNATALIYDACILRKMHLMNFDNIFISSESKESTLSYVKIFMSAATEIYAN